MQASSPTCTGKAMMPTLNEEQPRAAMEMKVMNADTKNDQQQQSSHCEHKKAWRGRGGGVAKDCFIGAIACFLCFECCEGCCDCIGDIICCPCEICCG